QVPVLSGVIEAVTDDELGPDLETNVPNIDIGALNAFLDQQGGDLERFWFADPKALHQVTQSESRIDHVLHDQHVATGDLLVEILQYSNYTRCLGGRPVGGDRHEVELHRDVDLAGQV